MERYHTFERIVMSDGFNALKHQLIRVGPCDETEAWKRLAKIVGGNAACRLAWTDDGLPVQTWTGSVPRRYGLAA